MSDATSVTSDNLRLAGVGLTCRDSPIREMSLIDMDHDLETGRENPHARHDVLPKRVSR